MCGDSHFVRALHRQSDYKRVIGRLSVLELCAGAGGQALGFEMAGFEHAGLVELDSHACKTLRYNRPKWDVRNEDLNFFGARSFSGVDVIAAGLPCSAAIVIQ